MERELSPVFRQARDAIERLLDKYGFRLTRETYVHAAMGSAQIEYRHRAHWLQLAWDGKERQLELMGAISPDPHAHPGASAWRSLGPTRSPDAPLVSLEPGPTTEATIAELLTEIELFRASKAEE